MSDFLTSQWFKQLIVPYGISGVPYITQEQAFNNLYWIRLNANLTLNNLIAITQFQFGTSTPAPYFNGGNYNTGTRKFVAPADRTYNFQLRVTATLVQSTGPSQQVPLTSNLYKNGVSIGPNMVVLWDVNTPANTTITQDFFIQDTASVGDQYEIRYSGGAIGFTINVNSSNTYWLNQVAGTPLMQPGDTWDVLDYIIDNPNPNRKLNLAINSNLGVPDKLIDKFIEKIKRITEENRVNEFIVFTSCDTWGTQAEYIRNGLVFNQFWDNVNKLMSNCPRVNLTFMSTYNALSVPNYDKLIEGVYQLKKDYGSTDRYWASAVFLDTSYLRYPTHQTVQVLPQSWTENIFKQAQLADFLSVPLFENNRNIHI